MTIPEFMKEWSGEEETTQEQYDWLKEKATELRNLEQIISPLFNRAWSIMEELQSVVDENQEWTNEFDINSNDTAILYCYANGTLEILREIRRVFGIWNPDEEVDV